MKDEFIFLLLIFFRFITSESLAFQSVYSKQIIHSNSELGKICETSDGHNIIISKRNDKIILMSKLDKKGNFVYHETKFNSGYSKNAKICESKIYTGENGYSFYYESNGKEYLSQFKDEGADLKEGALNDSNDLIASILALKNGKIFYAGIKEQKAGFSKSIIELKILDPATQNIIFTLTLNASDSYDKFVSCAELAYNEVYCAYVQKENISSSLLKIQYFKVSSTGVITQGSPNLIKSFNAQFNSLKLIKIIYNRIGLLFQIGDIGKTEKNLYYFDLQVTPFSFTILGYEYIFDHCLYKTDVKDYTNDLIAVSENTIYVICEKYNNGKELFDFN